MAEITESEYRRIAFEAAKQVLLENGIDPTKQQDNQRIFAWLYSLDLIVFRDVWGWAVVRYTQCKDIQGNTIKYISIAAVVLVLGWLSSGAEEWLKAFAK